MPAISSLSQRARWASGPPISSLMHIALSRPELISLAAGFVDQHTLPVEATQAALEALFADPKAVRSALQYGSTPGLPALREHILARQLTADHVTAAESHLSIDQIVVTAGSNQLLHLLGDTLLDPGDIVLCAAPTYFVYLGLLDNLGARSVGVLSDDEGLIPEALEEQLEQLQLAGELARVKAIYVTTYYDNPSGVNLGESRRAEIVEIARRWSRESKIYVIEDAAYRELRYRGTDLPSLRAFDADGETVIVAGTFSKSFSPGLRIGWGILPPELVEPISHQKGNIDFGSPNFDQNLVATVLERGLYDPHIQRLRDAYSIKLEAMHAAALKYLAPLDGVRWQFPSGGLYIWLQVPREIVTGPNGALFNAAVHEGMLYVPGEYCYPMLGQPVRHDRIRLSFGVQTAENIGRGIQALARAIASCAS